MRTVNLELNVGQESRPVKTVTFEYLICKIASMSNKTNTKNFKRNIHEQELYISVVFIAPKILISSRHSDNITLLWSI